MRLFWIVALLPGFALAQTELDPPQEPLGGDPEIISEDDADPSAGPERIAPETVPGDVVILRGLDKMTSRVMDVPVRIGETLRWERLEITAVSCRTTVPGEKPDAYAWLEIRDVRDVLPNFIGWMIASSPGLNAMDHPRYDVWVTNCNISRPLMDVESAPQSE